MSCQCHQIGGPFIAEDPDCPVHGIEAQKNHDRADRLTEQARTEQDLEKLREIALELAALANPYS